MITNPDVHSYDLCRSLASFFETGYHVAQPDLKLATL